MTGQPVTKTVAGSSPIRTHALGGRSVDDEVQVRELRDRVAHLLVDRAGDLAALDVRDRDVHVRRGDRGRERLVAVGDGDDDVGLEVVEHRRQLEQAEAGRLRRRDEVLALEHHVDARRDLEAVALDVSTGVAVALEQRRGGDDELQLESGCSWIARSAVLIRA